MECRTEVPDRKLLARLVLIREEARNMMGGGLLDERNDRGLNTLPESEVALLDTQYHMIDFRIEGLLCGVSVRDANILLPSRTSHINIAANT